MNRAPAFTLALIFLLSSSSATFADSPVFNDPREAIMAAKEGNRLVIFVLTKSFSEDGEKIDEILKRKLLGISKDFVIAKCRESTAAHVAMFKDRFKKDTTTLPLAVVTDVQGKVITSVTGTEEDEYEKLLTVARINTGLEKDPDKIAAAVKKFEDEEGDEFVGDTIFGMRKRDLGGAVLLSPKRTWTFVDGRTFEAALLEAKNQVGVFIVGEDTRKEVNFNDLSDDDKSYLGALLGGSN